jgi:membrane protein insertase Oxa1/YidC/SpoIIIJ
MKRLGLILTTLGLFAISLYIAFKQGSVPVDLHGSAPESMLETVQASPYVYSGLKGEVANIFSVIFNGLMSFLGGSVMLSIIALALIVELMLLGPSVHIQLKQKKIHLFHKKLVDRFNSGELSVSKTEEELYKLYDVNEKIHHKGALMVAGQVALFFFTFWGLNLMVRAPELLHGSWNILNFSLITKAQGYLLPLIASLIYLFHSMVKIHYKEKEDYISSAQTTFAFVFAVIGAIVVFTFSGYFATALVVYFLTLVTFSTVRYIIVEQHAKEWGSLAQRELIEMLKVAEPHKDRFEYFSRLWSHMPVVRHVNFNLLEEALSMTLGLLLALSFFGAFQKTDAQTSVNEITPPAVAQDVNCLT